MAFTLAILCLCLIAAWILWNIYLIASNYFIARKMGLPIIICPVDTLNPLWQFARPVIAPRLRRLPFGLGGFVRYSYIGWPWEHRYQLHARYGPAFTIVSPGECQVVIGDVRAANNILNRWKDFTKNPATVEGFNIFGPNLLTAEGETWQRHRRITIPPFNERNSALVWTEAIKQAREMLEIWTSPDAAATTRLIKSDTSTVALNILSGAGFGKSVPFDSTFRKPEPGHELSFINAIHTVTDNIITSIVLTSVGKIPTWLLPKTFSHVKTSIQETKQYMIEMVEAERATFKRGVSSDVGHNLMSNLVKVSEQAKLEQDHNRDVQSSRRPGLSDDELLGNLFLYNIAGHETTASALAYGIPLLAAYPEVQDWMAEEIHDVLRISNQEESLRGDHAYEEAFPHLKRCLAVMMETLRLYGPIHGFPRWTGHLSQSLKIGERTVILPRKTAVVVNNGATQTNPAIWGDDADSWRPSRWITSGGDSGEEELLSAPTKDAFLAWSSGPRVCPGLKFSQVEFVGVMAEWFRSHRVELIPERGESMDDARRRFKSTIEDSHMLMTVQIRHPERLKVRWVPRKKS